MTPQGTTRIRRREINNAFRVFETPLFLGILALGNLVGSEQRIKRMDI